MKPAGSAREDNANAVTLWYKCLKGGKRKMLLKKTPTNKAQKIFSR